MTEDELVNALHELLKEARRAEQTPIVRSTEAHLAALHNVVTCAPELIKEQPCTTR